MSRRTSAAQSLAHHDAAVDMAMDQTPNTAHLMMDTITRLPPLASDAIATTPPNNTRSIRAFLEQRLAHFVTLNIHITTDYK
jgi:hypothetical protein